MANNSNNFRPDESVMQPAAQISSGAKGVQMLLNSFNDGTNEVKNLLNFECDVIMECRFCRNLFRSLPSFVAHKRIYCKESSKSDVETAPNLSCYSNSNDESFNEISIRPPSAEPCPTLTNMTTTSDAVNNEEQHEHTSSYRTLLKTSFTNKSKMRNKNDNKSENNGGGGSRNASKMTLNFLNRLTKRMESANATNNNSDIVYRYAPITRTVPRTKLENGINILHCRSDLEKLPTREKWKFQTTPTVTMVVPQDAAHRQHTMALRTRRNWNSASSVKELSADDVKICDKIESMCGGQFDVSTLSCLNETCRKTFKSCKTAAFHVMYVHNVAPSSCLLCDDDDDETQTITFGDGRALKNHLEQLHFYVMKRHNDESTSLLNTSHNWNNQTPSVKLFDARGSKLNVKLAEVKHFDDEIKKFEKQNEDDADDVDNVDDSAIKEPTVDGKEKSGESESESVGDDNEEKMEEEEKGDKGSSDGGNGEMTKIKTNNSSSSKTTWQQRELAKLSSNLRTKRVLQSPYNSTEFESSLPKRKKRSTSTGSITVVAVLSNSKTKPKHSQIKQEIISSPDGTTSSALASSNLDKFPVIFTQKQKEQAMNVMDHAERRCRQCGAVFTNKCNLERHCYGHLGFVRFKCSKCEMGSFYRTELRRHLRTACPKMDYEEKQTFSDEKLNSLIHPVFPNEPGKVIVWRSGGGGGSTLVKKPSPQKTPTKKTMKKSTTNANVTENKGTKNNEMVEIKSGETLSIGAECQLTTSTTKNESRRQKNPPKKLLTAVYLTGTSSSAPSTKKQTSSNEKRKTCAKKLSDIKREQQQQQHKTKPNKKTVKFVQPKQEPADYDDDEVKNDSPEKKAKDNKSEKIVAKVSVPISSVNADKNVTKTNPFFVKPYQVVCTKSPVVGLKILNSASTSKTLLKPALKMVTGPDGKVYVKPFVPIVKNDKSDKV